MNRSEQAKSLGISRKTLYKHLKDGTLESVTPEVTQSVTPKSVTPIVTQNVAHKEIAPKQEIWQERLKVGFTPNWKRNGYSSAEQGRQVAVQMCNNRVPEAVIIYKGECHGGE